MQLIKGTFKSQEAIRILTELVNIKIKFHEGKISQSHNEEDIKMRENRIKELQKYLKQTREMLIDNPGEINMDAFVSLSQQTAAHENFKLIDGTFDAQDAMSILLNAYESKIQFHSLSAFGKEERGESGVEQHYQRITELKKEASALEHFLELATASKQKVSVSCTVVINLLQNAADELVSGQEVSHSY